MALILNKELETDNGLKVAEGTYLKVAEFYVNREKEIAQVAVQTFVNKEARFGDKKPFTIAGFNNVIQIPMTEEEVMSGNLYDLIYVKLNAVLTEAFGPEMVEDDK